MTAITDSDLALVSTCVMAKEPLLVFSLSHPQAFHCSVCGKYGEDFGAFDTGGWAIDVIDAFRRHVQRHHSKDEDYSRAPVNLKVSQN